VAQRSFLCCGFAIYIITFCERITARNRCFLIGILRTSSLRIHFPFSNEQVEYTNLPPYLSEDAAFYYTYNYNWGNNSLKCLSVRSHLCEGRRLRTPVFSKAHRRAHASKSENYMKGW